MSSEEVQISCKFVTRLPEQYRIAPTPIAVPGKLTRYGLSEVINHLLNLDPPKPFDFLVQGELVRTSLEKLNKFSWGYSFVKCIYFVHRCI